MVKISNKKFQIIDSVDPKLTEVVVTFKVDGVFKRHYIFLRKENGKSNASYLKDAEKQFELDLKNKKVTSLKGKNKGSIKGSSKGMKVAVVALSATTLAFGGLFAYKYIVGGNGGNYHTVTFDVEGGTPGIKSVKVVDGETIKEPDFKPSLDGDELIFWSTSEPSIEAEAYDFSKPVTADLTLHAVYPIGEEITYEKAQEWLNNHYKGDVWCGIQSGDYSWDYSESIPDKDNPGQFTQFGLPFLVAFLIHPDALGSEAATVFPYLISAMETTKESKVDNVNIPYLYDFGLNTYDGAALVSYMNRKAVGKKPTKCEIKNDKLCVTYNREEKIPSDQGNISLIISETDTYDLNCRYTKMKFKMNETMINYPGLSQGAPIAIPAFKGELNGHVYANYNLSNYNEAYKWVSGHYDEEDNQRQISKKIFSWDFRETEDEASQTFVINYLKTLTGDSELTLDDLYCKNKEVIPAISQTLESISPDEFESSLGQLYNAKFVIIDDELNTEVDDHSFIYGFAPNVSILMNNKCFQYVSDYTFIHETSEQKEGVEITGHLHMYCVLTNIE